MMLSRLPRAGHGRAAPWPARDGVLRCIGCGCTEDDCSVCIRRTGAPCEWVSAAPTGAVCSACHSIIVRTLRASGKGRFVSANGRITGAGQHWAFGFLAALRGESIGANPYGQSGQTRNRFGKLGKIQHSGQAKRWRDGHAAGEAFLEAERGG